jgi:hypothetical protein
VRVAEHDTFELSGVRRYATYHGNGCGLFWAIESKPKIPLLTTTVENTSTHNVS